MKLGGQISFPPKASVIMTSDLHSLAICIGQVIQIIHRPLKAEWRCDL